MQWYVEPIRATDGRITHFFALQRDVTQELEIHQQQRALEQAIGQLDDGVVLFGRDGRVRYVNKAYCQWVGSTNQSVLGMPAWKLLALRSGRASCAGPASF